MTSYLGTKHSSKETTERSRRIAEAIGSHHFDIGIDEVCDAIKGVFAKATLKTPKFVADGGQYAEDLAL